MRVPESLAGLLDQGIIQEIVRPLMSGKEAQVYLVTAGGKERVAKIYKDAQHRSFQQRAEYTEGRRTRNSRDQRAMHKRTRYGRQQDEAAWKSAEVDMIYRLRYAGVRVPEPYNFVDGVLLMELVQDANGYPAPRLAELDFSPGEAREIFDVLLQEAVKMLCAGVVHGDLSEYNVLLAESGPVIIDFPQSVDAAANQSAKRLLLRDVDNLQRFLHRFDHRARRMPYGQEIWSAYERNRLTPGMALTGRAQRSSGPTDTRSLLDEIGAVERDEAQRRRAQGLPPRRREVTVSQPSGGRSDGRRDGRGPSERREPRVDNRGPAERREPRAGDRGPSERREPRADNRAPAERHPGPPPERRGSPPADAQQAQAPQDGAPRKRRRRRRKPGSGAGAPNGMDQAPRPAESHAASAPIGGEADGPRAPSPPRHHDGPREPRGALEAAQRNGAVASETSGAPPKKRRRRRRRRPGEGQPPTGHPAA